jgi:glycosyltransferase involved in cell wall biosynthesis
MTLELTRQRRMGTQTDDRECAVLTRRVHRPIKIGLLSSGLGAVNRGFEITTARWYESIKDLAGVEAKVYAGGNYPGSVRGWNLRRDLLLHSPLRHLASARERGFWETCYTVEQVTFSVCLPDLLFWRPHIVWTKEVPLAHFLLAYKYMFGLRYKIIFANGGAFKPSTYKPFDFIQHLHPDSFKEAEAAGIPADRMEVLPNCVFYNKPALTREELRTKYGYEDGDWIIVCVAAWNSFQKRLDYLIDEVSKIRNGRVKLLLCGQPELETDSLKQLAAEKLGSRVQWLTLLPEEVHEALTMSDVFVLPSFREGLASSIIEAAMAGLPIISHPHSGGKFILQDDTWMLDMSVPGALTERLKAFQVQPPSREQLSRLQNSAQSRFSKEVLPGKFIDMCEKILA